MEKEDMIILTYEDIATNNSSKFYECYADAQHDLEYFKTYKHICDSVLGSKLKCKEVGCRGISCNKCPFYATNLELFERFISTLLPTLEELKSKGFNIPLI